MTAVRDAALRFHDAGITVVPVKSDGSKQPALTSWKQYITQPPTREVVERWFGDHVQGVGVLTGTGSNGLAGFDFEPRSNTGDFRDAMNAALIAAGLFDLWLDVMSGYCEATAGDGWHVLVFVDDATAADLKGRKVIVRGGETFMEIRGQGHMLIVAPSHGGTHKSGNPYRMLDGGIDSIQHITVEQYRALLDAFANMSDTHRQQTRTDHDD